MIVFHRYGRALRLLREKKGKSQKQVAAASGVTPPMLSAYENERTEPELESLDKVLAGMGATLGELTWALDVVNDRLPGASPPSAPVPARPAGESRRTLSGGGLETAFLGMRPLPAEMEAGYAQILSGLMRVSRLVVESMASAAADDGPE